MNSFSRAMSRCCHCLHLDNSRHFPLPLTKGVQNYFATWVSWPSIVFNGPQWHRTALHTFKGFNGILWPSLVFHGLSWPSILFYSPPWYSMALHGIPWPPWPLMVFNGFQKPLTMFQGPPRPSMNCQGPQWCSMALHGPL